MFRITILSFLILLTAISVSAQKNSYDSLWKKIDALDRNQGLTKSALALVDQVYKKAKTEKNDGQVLKALIRKIALQANINDDGDQSIPLLQKEIAVSSGNARSILESLLAEAYRNYYQNNRYTFLSRTPTTEPPGEDFTTRGFADFQEQIARYYLLSIQPAEVLQKTSLAPFDPIISKGNARYLRPTLYDLLAHRAIAYFRNEERDILQPEFSFNFDRQEYFAPADEFIRLKIQSKDTASVHHKALVILQHLMAFHKNDPKPDAFIYADLERVQLVHQFGVMENKEALYMRALQAIVDQYTKQPAAAKAMYYLATIHSEKGDRYNTSRDSADRYEYLKAEAICKDVLAQPSESEGKSLCRQLLNTIQGKNLQVKTEVVNLPLTPFRSLVTYKNLSSIFLRLVKLDDTQVKNYSNNYREEFWKEQFTANPLRSWEQKLPASEDRQTHSAEIKIDGLPIGAYMLLASNTKNFDLDAGFSAAQLVHVSRISFVQNGLNYFVMDRETGKPLEKAAVQFWSVKYDYNLQKNNVNKTVKLESDKNGHFSYFPPKGDDGSPRMEFTYNADHLFTTDQVNIYFDRNQDRDFKDAQTAEKAEATNYIFTDRGIYRPGQTVFFKSLLLTKEFRTGRPKLMAGEKTTFVISDVNGQKIDSVQLQTNEFGSCTGQFRIPGSGLTGQFRISNSNFPGEASIRVEEYKRPKFEVQLKDPEGIFKLGDSILVSGTANAFAGNSLGGATVKYRVVRTGRLLYPWIYEGKIYRPTPSMEISNGSILTDENGNFRINFKAIPDLSIQPSLEPAFDYRITADITDINGETHSDQLTVAVSYKGLQLHIKDPSGRVYVKQDVSGMRVNTQNMSGQFQPSKLVLSFYPLEAPKRMIRPGYWPAPDQYVMTREEFLKDFPLDDYGQEKNYKTWKSAGDPIIFTDSATRNGSVRINGEKIKSGWYRFEAVTHDRYGSEIKDIQYLRMIDSSEQNAAGMDYFVKAEGTNLLEPGSAFTVTIGTSAPDVYLFREIDTTKSSRPQSLKDANTIIDILRLNRESKTFKYAITEQDRGGLGIQYFFVKDNRLFVSSSNIDVLWTNKDLDISYETSRDKTLPGALEKWKLKISGKGRDKLASELLASMYDVSLDQFASNRWNQPDIWPVFRASHFPSGLANFSANNARQKTPMEKFTPDYSLIYDNIIPLREDRVYFNMRGMSSMARTPAPAQGLSEVDYAKSSAPLSKRDIASLREEGENPTVAETKSSAVKARSDFRETAFFLPQLYTDSSGNIEFSFTMPEALTRWKFQVLAHTKDLSFGYSSREIITQKELMVQPNPTRFLREGDHLELTTKVVNLSAKEMTGTVHLELFDAATMEPVDGFYQNSNPNQYFTAAAGQSALASFPIQVPFQYGRALLYRFTAKTKSGNEEIGDGEEAILPVLTNSILVTETLTLPMKGNNSQQFNFEKLIASGKSETLKNQALTVEFTTNPSWYALMSLPYLAETDFHCSERAFNQYYANAMAIMIAGSSPKIRSVIERWKTAPKTGSGLQKNEELKAVILQETPWLAEGLSDSVQKQNLYKLFETALMDNTQSGTLAQLAKYQTSNGGFTWFEGGREDRFITQYIITGLGHLKQLGAGKSSPALEPILLKGITYLDKSIADDYAKLLKNKADLKTDQTGYFEIQYLYARSFFPERATPVASSKAVEFYKTQAGKYWVSKNKFIQGMIALIMSRNKQPQIAANILRSLKENSIHNNELGTYWKDVRPGYYWYQAPVETQALMIEAFTEISKDDAFADDLKTWLLKQKQTTHWPSTKATADACYALLLKGTDWLGAARDVDISLGTKKMSSTSQVTEAGTGYFTQSFPGSAVTPDMGKISVNLSSGSATSPAWGAVYWQYFERVENITASATGVQIVKKIYIEKNSDKGPVLVLVKQGDAINVGDRIKVRMEIKSDRDLEYVQLKDMRASSFEPVNTLSGYKWAGGMGYYEATGDASTSFFFDRLPKGTHVFEYPLFAAQKGNFSNGITTIQCLYAPEFASHSEGIRVNVE